MFDFTPRSWEMPFDSPLLRPATSLLFPHLLGGERVHFGVQLRPSPFRSFDLILYLRRERDAAGFWAPGRFEVIQSASHWRL